MIRQIHRFYRSLPEDLVRHIYRHVYNDVVREFQILCTYRRDSFDMDNDEIDYTKLQRHIPTLGSVYVVTILNNGYIPLYLVVLVIRWRRNMNSQFVKYLLRYNKFASPFYLFFKEGCCLNMCWYLIQRITT